MSYYVTETCIICWFIRFYAKWPFHYSNQLLHRSFVPRGEKKKKKCHRYLTVFNNRLIKAEYGLQFSTILVRISRITNENCGQWLTLLELQCVITPDKEKHLRTHFQQNNVSNKGFFPVTVCLVCLNTTCSALPTEHSKSSVFIQSTLECQVLIYLLLKPISLPLKAH